jgi:hypothetical protein
MSKINACPKCGSKDLDWWDSDISSLGDTMIYPYDCNNCGFLGEEIHDLSFRGHRDRNTLEFLPKDN